MANVKTCHICKSKLKKVYKIKKWKLHQKDDVEWAKFFKRIAQWTPMWKLRNTKDMKVYYNKINRVLIQKALKRNPGLSIGKFAEIINKNKI